MRLLKFGVLVEFLIFCFLLLKPLNVVLATSECRELIVKVRKSRSLEVVNP
jgi:hypothetical protein